LFKDDDDDDVDIHVVFNRCENSNTIFLGWLEANQNYINQKN